MQEVYHRIRHDQPSENLADNLNGVSGCPSLFHAARDGHVLEPQSPGNLHGQRSVRSFDQDRNDHLLRLHVLLRRGRRRQEQE